MAIVEMPYIGLWKGGHKDNNGIQIGEGFGQKPRNIEQQLRILSYEKYFIGF